MATIPSPRPPQPPSTHALSSAQLLPQAPQSVQAPQPPVQLLPQAVRELWWLGCHPDAGTSTLAYLTGVGIDQGILAPRLDFENLPGTGVVLVCRASDKGTQRAQFTLGRYERLKHRPVLVGFVAVAAGPGKMPPLISQRLALLRQCARVWKIAWTREHLVASPDKVGAHPSVQRLAADLRRIVVPERAQEHRAAVPDPARPQPAASAPHGRA